jgi:dihydrofolate reductase
MATIHLFIASSLDGYIARPDGSLDWLEGHPNPDQLDYGYMDFLAGIDTVVMGGRPMKPFWALGWNGRMGNATPMWFPGKPG